MQGCWIFQVHIDSNTETYNIYMINTSNTKAVFVTEWKDIAVF